MFIRNLLAGALVAVAGLSGCAGTGRNEAPAASVPSSAPAEAQAARATPGGTHYAVVGSQSRATYAVREKFANRELPSDAVGSTSSFQGELVLAGGALQPGAKITVDLRTLRSDSQKRDYKIARWASSRRSTPWPSSPSRGWMA